MIEKLILKFHRLRFRLLYGYRKATKCHIYGNFSIIKPSNFMFGENLSVNDFVYINATNKIYVGDNVSLSAGAKLLSTKLNFSDDKNIFEHVSSNISIGDNVQVGSGAIILPGVKIADNVIIGAGCVVTKDIKVSGVYTGIPARKIK
ncbi:acyltransferase [Vibrio sp. ZSDE26]|uniref:Acyltransferase n=1 Tax=Vibrio amylolyticus TaxID=2847292 RepID=A0A9X2BKT7_9VIBR|nr:acyltransferase [Vibrio amylolyticus]MCK6263213.1 acyltransferase [Vibrio amylolyticus]